MNIGRNLYIRRVCTLHYCGNIGPSLGQMLAAVLGQGLWAEALQLYSCARRTQLAQEWFWAGEGRREEMGGGEQADRCAGLGSGMGLGCGC